MLVKNLPFETLPQAASQDHVYNVLSLMADSRVQHLALEQEGKFAGIISEDALMDVNDELALTDLQHLFQNHSVQENDHFLKAIALAATYNLTIVPVVDAEGNLVGVLNSLHLLKHIADFLHLQEPGALVVLEVDSQHYSFSEISKIVETNDAQITQLNTSRIPDTGNWLVTVRVNKFEISDIVASFQRYEYNVRYYSGEELYTNELKDNYENLMNYLNI